MDMRFMDIQILVNILIPKDNNNSIDFGETIDLFSLFLRSTVVLSLWFSLYYLTNVIQLTTHSSIARYL